MAQPLEPVRLRPLAEQRSCLLVPSPESAPLRVEDSLGPLPLAQVQPAEPQPGVDSPVEAPQLAKAGQQEAYSSLV